ncbi:hypothetical protein ACGCUQ_07690 [Eubacteriales bacterium KG127]
MKKTILLIVILIVAISISACGDKKSSQDGKISEDQVTGSKSVQQNNNNKKNPADKSATVNNDEEYPHDVATDRKKFKNKNIDIKFTDKNFVSLINDLYINPASYVGQTVEIEGFYIWDGFRTYVGRKGPACPCCATGYTGIEFHGDEKSVTNEPVEYKNEAPPPEASQPQTKNPDSNYEKFIAGYTWIKVKGYIRQGKDPNIGSFTYIEAIYVEPMAEKGTETVN